MRVLLCCETYYPSGGGVAEVMRQIAERLAQYGHTVAVATGAHPQRTLVSHNNVAIHGFDVAGNLVRGISGEVEKFREFVIGYEPDAILIKAAQQWTFDALWPILDQIQGRKVLIPCGYSGLYEPDYALYFRQLPAILQKFDHLIFYAEKYRDIDFARTHGLTHFSVLPNGASEIEFERTPDPVFRARLGIPEQDFVFLTVGSPISMKGHKAIAEAFARLDTGGRTATLILNGNWPVGWSPPALFFHRWMEPLAPFVLPAWSKAMTAISILRREGIVSLFKRAHRKIVAPVKVPLRLSWEKVIHAKLLLRLSYNALRTEGWPGFEKRVRRTLRRWYEQEQCSAATEPAVGSKAGPVRDVVKPLAPPPTIEQWIERARSQPGKTVLCTNLPRQDVVQAYLTADLFVFASVVEYSPLVLFEAAAAGTPFLTVPVGNSEEIARWTGGGIVCPAPVDERGYTRVDPGVLMREMQRCLESPELLEQIGRTAKQRWREEFTWQAIAPRYEKILSATQAECARRSSSAI
jgi:glycosyltransferase involved in cell wall biosynthesis